MIVDTFIGVVTKNDADSQKEFGVYCYVEHLDPNGEYPEIFKPLFPVNMVKAPEVGQQIEVFVLADEINEPGFSELGVFSNPEYCYYTGRIFDEKNGKIPKELKQNYPNRAGLFWSKDGTIIFYDQTPQQRGLMISLTDKKVTARFTEDEIVIQKDLSKITLKDNQIMVENGTAIIDLNGGNLSITNTTTTLGSPAAAQPILLGGTVIAAFNVFFTAWLAAVSTAENDPSGIQDPVIDTYIRSLGSTGNIISTIQGTTTTWPSVKHKVDA